MYSFIFYFIYRSQVNQKSGGPAIARYIGSLIVFLVVLIHVGLVYSLIRFCIIKLYNESIAFSHSDTYNQKVLFWLPIFVAIILFIYGYFNKGRIDKILNKYNNTRLSYKSFISVIQFKSSWRLSAKASSFALMFLSCKLFSRFSRMVLQQAMT